MVLLAEVHPSHLSNPTYRFERSQPFHSDLKRTKADQVKPRQSHVLYSRVQLTGARYRQQIKCWNVLHVQKAGISRISNVTEVTKKCPKKCLVSRRPPSSRLPANPVFSQDLQINCQHILKEQIVGHVEPSRETGRWLWCKTGQFRLCSGFRGCVNFYCILNFN